MTAIASDPGSQVENLLTLVAQKCLRKDGNQRAKLLDVFSGFVGKCTLVALILFVVCLIFAVLAKFFQFLPCWFVCLRLLALVCLLLGNAAILIGQSVHLVQLVRALFDSKVFFLSNVKETVMSDYLFSCELSLYSSEALDYVASRLHIEAEQMRVRLGVVVGTLDKVGLLPLILGCLITLNTYSNGPHQNDLLHWNTIYLEIGLAVLGIVYLAAVIRIWFAQRLDAIAGILEFSKSQKDSETTK